MSKSFAGLALVTTLVATLGVVLSAGAAAAQGPAVTLRNKELKALVYLPDAKQGFYRATRFDWSGVVASLRYKGHDFVTPWYQATDPAVRDLEFRGDQVVTGPASTMPGFPEEFASASKTAPGWEEAAVGGTFVKVGVGVLRKPDDKPYDRFRVYELVAGAHWVVQHKDNWIEFTQTVSDAASGYGYIYTKRVTLTPGKPQLVIEHRLRNTGARSLDGQVYDHNFMRWDNQPPGPDYSVTFAFNPGLQDAPLTPPLALSGNTATFERPLVDKESIRATPVGFGGDAKDYDFRFENRKLGIGLRATADRPVAQFAIWGIRSVFAVEPFIAYSVAPGAEFSWKLTYDAYPLPAVAR
jgi:hypothetical protein